MSEVLRAFLSAAERLLCRGRVLREPPGQDGVNCQGLALLDQLRDVGLATLLPPGLDAAQLRAACQLWLKENSDVVVDDELFLNDELSLLRDYGTEYEEYIRDSRAYGSHPALLAALAVLSKLVHRNLQCEVCAH